MTMAKKIFSRLSRSSSKQVKATGVSPLLDHCNEAKTQALHRPPRANQTLKRYLMAKLPTKVLVFFKELFMENRSAVDSYSLLYSLKACIQSPSFTEGWQLHSVLKKLGLEPNVYLQTCLIHLYSSMGNLEHARSAFNEIQSKNAICWTSLFSAHVENGKPDVAMDLFRQMRMSDVEPDKVSLTVSLAACADLGALKMGEWVHSIIQSKHGLEIDLSLNNALINMYARCGDVNTARRLFYRTSQRDVTTWTSMIVGLAVNGQVREALDLFAEMKLANIVPNDITFLGVLMACSHGGLVKEGDYYFRSMVEDYRMNRRLPHYGCMVDLLCRAGLVQEAYEFILESPIQPNSVVWRTLLGACYLQDNVELGWLVRKQLLEMDAAHVGDDVTLSNIFASRGMWDEKVTARGRLKGRRRPPGCSSIELGLKTCEFVAGDVDHPEKVEIFDVLERLMGMVKAYDYTRE